MKIVDLVSTSCSRWVNGGRDLRVNSFKTRITKGSERRASRRIVDTETKRMEWLMKTEWILDYFFIVSFLEFDYLRIHFNLLYYVGHAFVLDIIA